MVQELFNAKRKVFCNERDIWGYTPLHRAVINYHFDTAEVSPPKPYSTHSTLPPKRIPPMAHPPCIERDIWGYTPLHRAVINYYFDTAEVRTPRERYPSFRSLQIQVAHYN